jgi:hypothetical protein
MLEGKPPNLTHVVTFGSPCMVYRKPGKNSLKKRSQRGVILGISEEVKGCRVYLVNDKKVVVTQHVKYIETLSRAQNFSLLTPTAPSVISPLESTGSATSPADSHPVHPSHQHFQQRSSSQHLQQTKQLNLWCACLPGQ